MVNHLKAKFHLLYFLFLPTQIPLYELQEKGKRKIEKEKSLTIKT